MAMRWLVDKVRHLSLTWVVIYPSDLTTIVIAVRAPAQIVTRPRTLPSSLNTLRPRFRYRHLPTTQMGKLPIPQSSTNEVQDMQQHSQRYSSNGSA